MPTISDPIAPRGTRLLFALVALALGGCVEQLPEARVGRGDIRNAIAKGNLTSPRGATVAMASLDGAPDSVAARFNGAFRKQAAEREITVADATAAHYLVRGYLSASTGETGTSLSYVYDIFDAADHRRVDRVSDVLTVPGSGGDAWARLDDRAMESLAGRSADDLAVALAGTPEARAAAVGTVKTAAATPVVAAQ